MTAKKNYLELIDNETKKDDRAKTDKMEEWKTKHKEEYEEIQAMSKKGVHTFVKFLWEKYPPNKKDFDGTVDMENFDNNYKKKLCTRSFMYYHPDKADKSDPDVELRCEIISRF